MRFYFLVILILASCQENKVPYETLVDYEPLQSRKFQWAEKLYNPDSVYLFFETGFEGDFITVKCNSLILNDTITTNELLGVAKQISVPATCNSVKINKSKGPSIEIDLKRGRSNKWSLYFYSDTLFAKNRLYAPIYE